MPGDKDAESAPSDVPETSRRPSWPRRSRRIAIPGVLIAVDAPGIAEEPWVVDALDISAFGLGLMLPPELAEGTEVLLSFKLDEQLEFSRLPATVQHREGTSSGGVRFNRWPDAERLKLLEYLVHYYEGAIES